MVHKRKLVNDSFIITELEDGLLVKICPACCLVWHYVVIVLQNRCVILERKRRAWVRVKTCG